MFCDTLVVLVIAFVEPLACRYANVCEPAAYRMLYPSCPDEAVQLSVTATPSALGAAVSVPGVCGHTSVNTSILSTAPTSLRGVTI